jgi:hypothetical protein
MRADLQATNGRASGLVDVLDRVLDKGLVVAGDIKISLAEVELLTIRIRLIVCSIDKAEQIGLDWWRYDTHLAPGGSSLIDVLDRVLDKGIVIDAWVRVSLVGIDLITVEARVVVASIDTYLKYSEAVGSVAPVSKPALASGDSRASEAVLAENATLRAQLAAAGRDGSVRRRRSNVVKTP